MRLLNIVLCLLMVVFVAVQYNDPDGAMWMAIYAIPAVWTAIAGFRRRWLGAGPASVLLLFSIVAAVAGMVYFRPSTAGWWHQEVWWEVETAREGMGLMIVTLVLVAVWFSRPRGDNMSDAQS